MFIDASGHRYHGPQKWLYLGYHPPSIKDWFAFLFQFRTRLLGRGVEYHGSLRLAMRATYLERAEQATKSTFEVLTPVLTIAKYIELNIVKPWELHGTGLPERTFYYTEGWRKGVAALTPPPVRRMRHSPSPGARVAALVEEFVGGVPFAKLVSPVGSGIDPAFKRMRAPKQIVVAMRTYHTRTFGFFSKPNVFIGVCIELTQTLKSRPPEAPDPYLAFFAEVERFASRLDPAEVNGTSNVETLVFP